MKTNITNKTKKILELWKIIVIDTIAFNGSQNLALKVFLLGLKFSIDWFRIQFRNKKNRKPRIYLCCRVAVVGISNVLFKSYSRRERFNDRDLRSQLHRVNNSLLTVDTIDSCGMITNFTITIFQKSDTCFKFFSNNSTLPWLR